MDKLQPLPPFAELNDRLAYCKQSGRLEWRVLDRSYFSSDRLWNSYNARWAGRDAFTCRSDSGFIGRISGQHYYAHRIAYALATGAEPEGFIDHINGNPYDNRLANLRVVTKSGNGKNRGRFRATSRPYHGVCKKGPSWTATIKSDGQDYWLGSFKTLDEAIAARKRAEREHGFHQNHGKRLAGDAA